MAEDNVVNQRLALRILEKHGHVNGRRAIEAQALEHFDMVLMDVPMPEIDGLEATQVIRRGELKTGGHIPIFAMTAHAMQ